MEADRTLRLEEIQDIVMEKQQLHAKDEQYAVCAVVFQVVIGKPGKARYFQEEARRQLDELFADFSDTQRDLVWNEALRMLDKLKERKLISPDKHQAVQLCPRYFIAPGCRIEPLEFS